MGREFLVQTFPQFEMTAPRRHVLKEMLHEKTIGELEDYREDHGFERRLPRQDLVEDLLDDIESCAVRAYTRDTAMMKMHDEKGRGFWVNMTGGTSYGDVPTECWDAFERANYFGDVYDRCENFSKSDYKDNSSFN